MDSEEQSKYIAELLKEKGYPDIFKFNGTRDFPVEIGLKLYRNMEHLDQYSKYRASVRLLSDVRYR